MAENNDEIKTIKITSGHIVQTYIIAPRDSDIQIISEDAVEKK